MRSSIELRRGTEKLRNIKEFATLRFVIVNFECICYATAVTHQTLYHFKRKAFVDTNAIVPVCKLPRHKNQGHLSNNNRACV